MRRYDELHLSPLWLSVNLWAYTLYVALGGDRAIICIEVKYLGSLNNHEDIYKIVKSSIYVPHCNLSFLSCVFTTHAIETSKLVLNDH